jgi:hypothetical protein
MNAPMTPPTIPPIAPDDRPLLDVVGEEVAELAAVKELLAETNCPVDVGLPVEDEVSVIGNVALELLVLVALVALVALDVDCVELCPGTGTTIVKTLDVV